MQAQSTLALVIAAAIGLAPVPTGAFARNIVHSIGTAQPGGGGVGPHAGTLNQEVHVFGGLIGQLLPAVRDVGGPARGDTACCFGTLGSNSLPANSKHPLAR